MKRKKFGEKPIGDFWKATVVITVALAFVMPGGAFANLGTTESAYNTMPIVLDNSQIDDVSAYRYQVISGGGIPFNEESDISQGTGADGDYPIGEIIWQYQITDPYDSSPKAIASIPDINDDGIDDVIVCSEDDYVRCFSGGAIGTGEVLWEHEIYSGSLWCQNELTITEDVDGDGYNDVVVGTPWGDRSIHTLSGETGEVIWTYGSTGGWVYQVDCSYDYNGDGVIDVLAATGGDARRVYCLDGLNGTSIWEYPLGGPGFSVIGVEDFTGDGQPDVIAGAANAAETIGKVYGINGINGTVTWEVDTGAGAPNSVWALEQIDDITNDGIKDVIIGDFTGKILGLDATTGDQIYSNSLGNVLIIRFAKLNDVNGDGHPDIVPAHSTTPSVEVIDGYTGDFIWSHAVADQPFSVARIADISGDAIDDVLVGTLFNNNYCYFLNGVNGSELCSINYYEAVDAIAAIPDVVGDYSMEMIAGGRNGKVVCFSGGLNASYTTLEIGNITGGLLRVDAEIKNIGDVEVTYVNWSITLDGGLMLLGKESRGTLSSISAGEAKIVTDRPVLGIGRVAITVTASAPGATTATKTANGLVLLFFVILY